MVRFSEGNNYKHIQNAFSETDATFAKFCLFPVPPFFSKPVRVKEHHAEGEKYRSSIGSFQCGVSD